MSVVVRNGAMSLYTRVVCWEDATASKQQSQKGRHKNVEEKQKRREKCRDQKEGEVQKEGRSETKQFETGQARSRRVVSLSEETAYEQGRQHRRSDSGPRGYKTGKCSKGRADRTRRATHQHDVTQYGKIRGKCCKSCKMHAFSRLAAVFCDDWMARILVWAVDCGLCGSVSYFCVRGRQ